jgi:hypothetical protein
MLYAKAVQMEVFAMNITRIAAFPWECHASASSAVNTTWPTAAPGEAGRPVAMT